MPENSCPMLVYNDVAFPAMDKAPQSFQDIDIIVVNNAGTDKTFQLLNRLLLFPKFGNLAVRRYYGTRRRIAGPLSLWAGKLFGDLLGAQVHRDDSRAEEGSASQGRSRVRSH